MGQILKLIYLRQYLSYGVDQKFKMSEMLMAICLVYSTSGKKVCRAQNGGHFENFDILIRYEKIVPNYAKKVFMVMSSSMTSQGGLKVSPYIHV